MQQIMQPCTTPKTGMFGGLSIVLTLIILGLLQGPLSANDVVVPRYFDAQERQPTPQVQDIFRLRFLTSVDFPPFGFLDQTGRLTGFHVELAREVCDVLQIIERCQIQALEWDALKAALQAGEGDALIAGLAINDDNRKDLLFSRSYLQLPARFLKHKQNNITDVQDFNLNDNEIAVLDGTAHQLMLASWFPELKVRKFADQDAMLQALAAGYVSAVFSDGLQLSFWQKSEVAKDCCEFWGGPYLSETYLGEGLAIAVPKDQPKLIAAINYGLAKLSQNGRFEELYFRYFPNGIY